MSWSSLRRLRHLEHVHPRPTRVHPNPTDVPSKTPRMHRNQLVLHRIAAAATLMFAAWALHASPVALDGPDGAQPNTAAASTRPLANWKQKVPARDRDRANPLADSSDAPAAGAHLFARNCAACHGAEAQGHGSRPSLRSTRVHDATDGELFWLLTNGELGHGMPSWARLPEPQRWQLVRFLHSLPTNVTPVTPAASSTP